MSETAGKQERRQQVADEVANDLRKERVEIKKQAEALLSLMAHPGWGVYRAIVTANAQNMMTQLQRPLKTPDEVMLQEYTKGALNGLSTALMIPQGKVDEAKSLGLFASDETAGNE